jgi:integration host factor subunit beta
MTRAELIERLAQKQPHLTVSDIEFAVKAMLDQITATLVRGDRVEIRGFGCFSIRRRDPRAARNPRTGEQVALGERYVPFFRAGKELRERVDMGS